MLCKRDLCCHAVSVCLSVCLSRSHSVKTSNHILTLFKPSGSHTTPVFSIQNIMAIFRREPPNGASNAGGVGRNRDFKPISGFIACCQRATAKCYQLGAAGPLQVVTLIAGSKRLSLLMAGDDDEMFKTRSLNVTPKTTEHHLIVRSD